MSTRFILFLGIFLIAATAFGQKVPKVSWKKVRVLVYTKNGGEYVHDNIPYAVEAIRKLSATHGFAADVSEDPNVFTEANLAQYDFLIFPSTNNDAFDNDSQRLALRRYIEGGGGFVGIHSAVGTERNWKWFKTMVGGRFVWHPNFQSLQIKTLDPQHPSMAGMPALWQKKDECYLMEELYPGVRVLMAHYLPAIDVRGKDKERLQSLTSNFGDYYPAVWYHHFGGPVWVTTLGHDKGDYQDPVFLRHIFQGMAWVATQAGKPDFTKAYATSHDAPLR